MAFKMNGWSPFTQIKGKKVTDTKKDVESPRWIGISKERKHDILEREYDKKMSKKVDVDPPTTAPKFMDTDPDVVKGRPSKSGGSVKKKPIPRLKMKKKVTKNIKSKKIYPKPIGRKV